jgi:REP element-mobilizing transposase RayT
MVPCNQQIIMTVRKKIGEPYGVFFITFTCARWLLLFQLTNGYHTVHKWFDYLKAQRHHIAGYVIMPSHVHALIAFSSSRKSINTVVGNGKRFMAYELVKLLAAQKREDILEKCGIWLMLQNNCKIKNMKFLNPRLIAKSVSVFPS